MDLEKIKDGLKPDVSVIKKIDSFIVDINSLLKKAKLKAVCVKGGSVAKGTFLKDDYDVDLFIKFDYNTYKDKDLSVLLKKALKNLELDTIHGSRDYYHFKTDHFNYELVPVLDLTDPKKAVNVTDMSPMHVVWVKKKLKKGQEDEIRLAKQFAKAAKVYGAESYINGFSGHVIDVLVIHYGSFQNLLKAASKWKPKVIIDTEKKLKNPLFELNKSKTEGPMVIVDPLLSSRNASAAISQEKLDKFIQTAKAYLKKPSEEFFRIKQFDIEDVKKQNTKNKVVIIDITTLTGKIDVVGAKTLKIYEYFKKELEKHEFQILSSEWKWDKKSKAQIYYVTPKEDLSKKSVKKGPPTKLKPAYDNFKKIYDDTFEKNGILYANTQRKYVKPEELLKSLTKEEYVKDKAKKVTITTK